MVAGLFTNSLQRGQSYDKRQKATSAAEPRLTERGAYLPLQQYEFGAEGGAHGGEDAVGAGGAGVDGEVVLEDGEDGGGGEVADLAEGLPGGGEGVGGRLSEVSMASRTLGPPEWKM